MKVVIIGAGMAGLSCAELLSGQENIEVIILEARDRIGGRIANADEFSGPIDLGASWIHGVKGNPLTAIAKRLGLSLDVTDNPNLTGEESFELYNKSGRRLDDEVEKKTRKRFELLTQEAIKYLRNLQDDASVDKALQAGRKKLPPNEQNECHHETDLLGWLISGIEGWENANLSDLSGRYHFLEWEDRIPLGGDGFIVSGYTPIIKDLAKHLQDKIYLSHQVNRLEYTDDGVLIETNQGTISADFVICTVPLGVLKSGDILFSPPLPLWKSRAIQYIGFGLMNKIVVEFPKVFWNPQITGIGYTSNDPQESFQFFLNLYPLIKCPILMCFITADFARTVEKWSDEQIKEKILSILTKIYGSEVIQQPSTIRITRWGSDPFSRGSYSFRTVGSTVSDIENLAKPVGRLHFAGEATYIDLGFAHGAYLSGRRAAQEVLLAMKRPTVSHFRHIASMRRPSL